MNEVNKVMLHTDWQLLSEQKLTLVRLLNAELLSEHVGDHLNGLLNLIDAVQDAAEKDGHAVVFLTEDIRPRSTLFDKEAPNVT